MAIPKQFTTVTLLSKTLAMVIFIVFPFVGFWLGIRYQETQTPVDSASQKNEVTSSKALEWKTYINNKYNVTFKYPQDLLLDVRYPTSDEEIVVIVAKPNTEEVERVWLGINSATTLYGNKMREEKIGSVTWTVTKHQDCNGMYCQPEVISYETFHNQKHYIINGDFISPQLVLYTFEFTK
jgi:hypothetical protein